LEHLTPEQRAAALDAAGIVAAEKGKNTAQSFSLASVSNGKILRLARQFDYSDRPIFPVLALHLSADGSVALSRETKDVFRIQDVKTAGITRVARDDQMTRPPTALALSADGARVLVGFADVPTQVWDAVGQIQGILEGHKGAVLDLAFLPDGKRAVTAGADHTVRLWDLTTFREIRQYAGHPFAVDQVAVSPAGNRLLTAGEDSAPILWDVSTGNQFRTLEGKEPLAELYFSGDGNQAIGWTKRTSALRIWDLGTGKIVREAASEPAAAHRATTPDGRFAVDATVDSKLRVWDTTTGDTLELMDFGGIYAKPSRVALDPVHGILVVGTTKAWLLKYRIDLPKTK
jgi:WD40 repeat protein